MTKIQFILKYRDNKYTCDPDYNEGHFSSGLLNSATFVKDMLSDILGFETRLDHAKDNNCIDRLVTNYKPDIVIIEAYWVVPEKFEILHKLHPNIIWVIRNHSPMPFASTEGIIVDWSLRYMDYPNVILACNDERADREFRHLIKTYKPDWEEDDIKERCVFLPNYYPIHFTPRPKPVHLNNTINIGCFGAIRPLKNQLIQAVAAIEYANSKGKFLRFHINGTRVEGRGDAILNNIRKLFTLIPHELVEHDWMPHHKFIELIKEMDVGMQVSYTESFNIVTADMVMNGVPVVTSAEIKWVNPMFHAWPNESSDIVKKLGVAVEVNDYLHFLHPNINGLHEYNEHSMKRWKNFILTADFNEICEEEH
jgi:hypothetical protein